MKKNKLTILPVVLISLFAASCGGTSGNPSSTAPSNPPASSVKPTEASSDNTPASETSVDSASSEKDDTEKVSHISVDTTAPEGSFAVVYDLNYNGCEAPNVVTVKKSRSIDEGAIPVPTREGYLFNGWFTSDTETDPTKAFSFRSKIKETTFLYAGWVKADGEHERTEKVFEAEYCRSILACPNGDGTYGTMTGNGYSGTATGKDMVSQDNGEYQASNGHYVTYLYTQGLSLDFDIYCSKDVTDAKFVARFSGEFMDVKLNPDTYTISVNGADLDYDEINIAKSSAVIPFADFTIANNLSLHAGKNTISFISSHALEAPLGTMGAMAPMFDCFKITTDAVMTWMPETANY